MTFEQLRPYWDALDHLFPPEKISMLSPKELEDYEKLCEAITRMKEPE